jgi:hypothetical protein
MNKSGVDSFHQTTTTDKNVLSNKWQTIHSSDANDQVVYVV